MKNTRIILLSLFVLMLSLNMSFAQNYKSQFNVKPTGEVENDKGVKLGWIEANGNIKNAKGAVVGKVIKKDKDSEALDKVGKKMGTVSEDGTLTGANGKVLYTISTADENGMCKILDASGKEVGMVHENYKHQAAYAMHCLRKKN